MKKLFSVLTVLLLLIGSTVSAFADTNQVPVTITVGGVECTVGDTVEIPIYIEDFQLSGLKDLTSSLKMTITYDSNDIDVLSVTPGDIVTNPQINFSSNITKNEITIDYTDALGVLGSNYIAKDGFYAWIKVSVKNVPQNNLLNIEIKSIAGINDGSSNSIKYPVIFLYDAISVRPNSIPGDLDGSGSVNSLDLAWMRKYLLGQTKEFPYAFANGDMNGDGDINSLDYAILRVTILKGD